MGRGQCRSEKIPPKKTHRASLKIVVLFFCCCSLSSLSRFPTWWEQKKHTQASNSWGLCFATRVLSENGCKTCVTSMGCEFVIQSLFFFLSPLCILVLITGFNSLQWGASESAAAAKNLVTFFSCSHHHLWRVQTWSKTDNEKLLRLTESNFRKIYRLVKRL